MWATLLAKNRHQNGKLIAKYRTVNEWRVAKGIWVGNKKKMYMFNLSFSFIIMAVNLTSLTTVYHNKQICSNTNKTMNKSQIFLKRVKHNI